MAKTAIYSWRLTEEMKRDLNDEARKEGGSIAALLERVLTEWLAARGEASVDEAQEQARIVEEASRWIGTAPGQDPGRSAQVRERVKERLEARRAR